VTWGGQLVSLRSGRVGPVEGADAVKLIARRRCFSLDMRGTWSTIKVPRRALKMFKPRSQYKVLEVGLLPLEVGQIVQSVDLYYLVEVLELDNNDELAVEPFNLKLELL
jgi:hypothetical protein